MSLSIIVSDLPPGPPILPTARNHLTLNPSPRGEGLEEPFSLLVYPPPRPWERGIRGGEVNAPGSGIRGAEVNAPGRGIRGGEV